MSKASGSSKRKKKRGKNKQASSTSCDEVPIVTEEDRDIVLPRRQNNELENDLHLYPAGSPGDVEMKTKDANGKLESDSCQCNALTRNSTETCKTNDGSHHTHASLCSLQTTPSNSTIATDSKTVNITNPSASVASSKSKSKSKPSSKPESAEVTPNNVSSQFGSSVPTTFEDELSWCVGQLELGMLRKDATKTQKQVNEKHIRTLQSTKTPLPKKRQLMRSLFGDYRSKMKSQPLPKKVQVEPKITQVEHKVFKATGTFYKQSIASCDQIIVQEKQDELCKIKNSSEQFSFGFEISDEMMM